MGESDGVLGRRYNGGNVTVVVTDVAIDSPEKGDMEVNSSSTTLLKKDIEEIEIAQIGGMLGYHSDSGTILVNGVKNVSL
ncbi:hypothetical protein QVD17_30582 [Tagetes erecta]|uniref:Uncharacterized protein n=1 Tax=Tagetes erecta TaxID=13708 RepID=A0AAD8K2Y9_TARER|nr:hypothetical protein QVD17_30582 [Tagetes erecta]